jgi:ubiquinone/menaquinone biosynthesis C-methylase UbiE
MVGARSEESAVPAALAGGSASMVISIDLAEGLFSRARDAERQHLGKIQFIQGDMERLGYPSDSFDGVISVFSVFFVIRGQRTSRRTAGMCSAKTLIVYANA